MEAASRKAEIEAQISRWANDTRAIGKRERERGRGVSFGVSRLYASVSVFILANIVVSFQPKPGWMLGARNCKSNS
jgi:hypothetical protein